MKNNDAIKWYYFQPEPGHHADAHHPPENTMESKLGRCEQHEFQPQRSPALFGTPEKKDFVSRQLDWNDKSMLFVPASRASKSIA